jgi:hypothetical protein
VVGRGELAGARWLDVPVDGRPLRERLTEIRHIGDEHRPGPGHRPDGAQSAIVANVSGPPGELVLAGMPLDGVHPILAPFGGVPIAVCALGRRGSLHVSVTADIGVLPDAGRFAAGLRRALDKLAAEFGADAGPGRSGAQTGTT